MKVQPLARQSSLVVKELDDETLVYDLESDQAHCLNNTASQVWKNCDGRSTVTEIAKRLGSKLDQAVDENVVWLALDQLEKFKLLDETPAKPAFLAGMTRRQMVARLGIAAVALPAIVSIISPHASAQGSPPPVPPGGCCKDPKDCGPGGSCEQPHAGPPPDPPCVLYPPNPQASTKQCY